MGRLVRHGMLNHSSEDVMRFLGGKEFRSGRLPASFAGELEPTASGGWRASGSSSG